MAVDPPNIVFILADDLGWSDIGCYGSTFHKTPNLDALARRGLLFRQAYAANPLCSPTRASILTGQYPARLGITAPVCHQPEVRLTSGVAARARPDQKSLVAASVTRLDTSYVTLAEVLRDTGYVTAHFGKWHLGREPYSALEHGFGVDVPHWFGPGPAGSYVAPLEVSASDELPRRAGRAYRRPHGHGGRRVHPRHRGRPFFLNYWCFSVHAPLDGKDNLVRAVSTRRRSDQPATPRGVCRHGPQP